MGEPTDPRNQWLPPFTIALLQPPGGRPPALGSTVDNSNDRDRSEAADGFPASYRQDASRAIGIPSQYPDDFLAKELSLARLEAILRHLWFAGAEHPAAPLHHQIALGRDIVVTERMDLHLLWTNGGRIFIKPLPHYLLKPSFWSEYFSCRPHCGCTQSIRARDGPGRPEAPLVTTVRPGSPLSRQCPRARQRGCALGFLHTYVCLLAYESDFRIAIDNHLLPRLSDGSAPRWEDWKTLVAEFLSHDHRDSIHPRFRRAELRLARLNTIHYFTQLPLFVPYFGGWRNYRAFLHDNLAWLATAAAFIALVLTAMQVGLATDQLKASKSFMAVSYGFTVFAILGPVCAFGLVGLAALYKLVQDLPRLLGMKKRHGNQGLDHTSQEGRV